MEFDIISSVYDTVRLPKHDKMTDNVSLSPFADTILHTSSMPVCRCDNNKYVRPHNATLPKTTDEKQAVRLFVNKQRQWNTRKNIRLRKSNWRGLPKHWGTLSVLPFCTCSLFGAITTFCSYCHTSVHRVCQRRHTVGSHLGSMSLRWPCS